MREPGRVKINSLILLALALCVSSHAQQSQPNLSPVFGSYTVTPKPEDVKTTDAQTLAGVRIRVKGADGKPVARKRFYLTTKSLEQIVPDWSSVPKRKSFLEKASPELRAWIEAHDCDSLYCPEYEAAFETGKESVPELKSAYAEGLKRHRDARLAVGWIRVHFPLKELRLGYYQTKKGWLARTAQAAGVVASVMTDERGEAYFTGVKTGSYFVSNLIPIEQGNLVWSAPVTVPSLLPGKLHSATVELIAKPK